MFQKINVAGRVEKRCGYSWACGLGGLERGAVSMWNAIKNSVSEGDLRKWPQSSQTLFTLIYA